MWPRYLNVTDGRTDGRTNCRSNTALCLESRGENTRQVHLLFPACEKNYPKNTERNIAHYVVTTNKLPRILNKRSKNTNHVVATHQIKFFLQSYRRGSVNLGLCYEMCSFYYKKMDHVTMWYPIYHFLLVVLWKQASISNGFRDI